MTATCSPSLGQTFAAVLPQSSKDWILGWGGFSRTRDAEHVRCQRLSRNMGLRYALSALKFGVRASHRRRAMRGVLFCRPSFSTGLAPLASRPRRPPIQLHHATPLRRSHMCGQSHALIRHRSSGMRPSISHLSDSPPPFPISAVTARIDAASGSKCAGCVRHRCYPVSRPSSSSSVRCRRYKISAETTDPWRIFAKSSDPRRFDGVGCVQCGRQPPASLRMPLPTAVALSQVERARAEGHWPKDVSVKGVARSPNLGHGIPCGTSPLCLRFVV